MKILEESVPPVEPVEPIKPLGLIAKLKHFAQEQREGRRSFNEVQAWNDHRSALASLAAEYVGRGERSRDGDVITRTTGWRPLPPDFMEGITDMKVRLIRQTTSTRTKRLFGRDFTVGAEWGPVILQSCEEPRDEATGLAISTIATFLPPLDTSDTQLAFYGFRPGMAPVNQGLSPDSPESWEQMSKVIRLFKDAAPTSIPPQD